MLDTSNESLSQGLDLSGSLQWRKACLVTDDPRWTCKEFYFQIAPCRWIDSFDVDISISKKIKRNYEIKFLGFPHNWAQSSIVHRLRLWWIEKQIEFESVSIYLRPCVKICQAQSKIDSHSFIHSHNIGCKIFGQSLT